MPDATRGLYPPVEPYEAGELAVSDGQVLYWETVGSPSGVPAVYLHGGPGAGCGTDARRLFDPRTFRAVLFDQRQCGRSRPRACEPTADLSTNTTPHLLADIERLRTQLGIQRWIVVGRSWGVTLALAYAQRHPERVIALGLAAITSARRQEIDWITRDMGRIFPDAWERFVSHVPAPDRSSDLSAAYARLLASPDPGIRARAAREWCRWEDTHVSLTPGRTPGLELADPDFQLTLARLITHYWSNGSFLPDDGIQRNMHRIAKIPGVMIHGRRDISGPLAIAWELHRLWSNSRLIVLDDAGHGGDSMTGELAFAIDSFRNLY